jgi:sarcosine oxidase gamma subunit
MPERLAATHPLDDLWQAALPAPTPALRVSVADGLRVVVIRHLPGGTAAVDEALAAHHLHALPAPGTCVGDDPWQVWLGPSESLLLTTNSDLADRALVALRPGSHLLACALDSSAAWLVFDLLGSDVDELLPRLLDEGAIPLHTGQGVRTRFMDIRAVVVRLGPERVWVAVDRSHGGSTALWIGHAWSAAQAEDANRVLS